jgi:hypothetical protein
MRYYVIKDMDTGRLLTGTGGQGGGSTLSRGGKNTPPKLYTEGSAKSVVTQINNRRGCLRPINLKIIPVNVTKDLSSAEDK